MCGAVVIQGDETDILQALMMLIFPYNNKEKNKSVLDRVFHLITW